jgi:hypothetical protein
LSGANRDRTGDLLLAKQALSQLSYGPAELPKCIGAYTAGTRPRPHRAAVSPRSAVEVEIAWRALLEPQSIVIGRLLEELGRLLQNVLVLLTGEQPFDVVFGGVVGGDGEVGGVREPGRRRVILGIHWLIGIGRFVRFGERLAAGDVRLPGATHNDGLAVLVKRRGVVDLVHEIRCDPLIRFVVRGSHREYITIHNGVLGARRRGRIAISTNGAECLSFGALDLRRVGASSPPEIEMLTDRFVEKTHETEGYSPPAAPAALASSRAASPNAGRRGAIRVGGPRRRTAGPFFALHFPRTCAAPGRHGAIAQLGERLDRTQEVASSSLASSIAQIARHSGGDSSFQTVRLPPPTRQLRRGEDRRLAAAVALTWLRQGRNYRDWNAPPCACTASATCLTRQAKSGLCHTT